MELEIEKIKKMNLYEKMSCITNELTRVAKNLSVGLGQAQYKAVGEAEVLAAVKPIEEKYRVYSYPFNRTIVETNVLTTTTEYNGKVTEKNSLFMRIETIYRFVNIDTPSEYIDITTYGDGVDPQDKAPGKSMTYADKYALLKAYKIETGDDPDQNKSEDLKKVAAKTKVTTPKPVAQEQSITEEQLKLLSGLGDLVIKTICEKDKVSDLKELTVIGASKWIKYCQGKGMIKDGE